MEALTAKASFVDPATSNETALTTSIPRSDVEEALKGGSTDLWLDVKRSRNGEDADRRITVSFGSDDLERLLASTSSDPVPLAFRPEELNRMFEEPDVEAQGMRETAAILTVALATAAGTAGAANAMVAADSGGGSASAAAVLTDTTSSGPAAEATAPGAQFVTDTTSSGPAAETPAADTQFVTDTTSSGPAAETPAADTQFVTDTTSSGPGAEVPAANAQFITDTTSGGPAQTAAEASSGGGSSWVETDAGEAALAGGIVLLIAAAGFATTRSRTQPPKPA